LLRDKGEIGKLATADSQKAAPVKLNS
jgi:hypothetical protein